MSSTDLLTYFPHKTIRSGQQEFVTDLHHALDHRQILLAHAPTGLGKTASALSIAIKIALEQKKKIFFLTNRHTQHNIAIETLKQIRSNCKVQLTVADLIGKRWMCHQTISDLFGSDFNEYCKTVVEKGECDYYENVRQKKSLQIAAQLLIKDIETQGALHNEELMSITRDKRMCGYEISLALAKDATVIIADYNYVFNSHVQSSFFNKIEWSLEESIVIIDEGHNLPARITDMLSTNLNTLMIKNAVLEAKKFGYGGVIIWLQEMARVVHEMSNFQNNTTEVLVSKEEFTAKIQKIVDYDQLVTELTFAADEIRKKQRKSFLGGIVNFLEAWQGSNEGYVRFLAEKQTKFGPVSTLSYLCLDPSIVTKNIFDRIHSGVIMSGTLKPTSMFKEILGITRAVQKEYTSPFPPENKLALVVPQTTTKFTERSDQMYQKIATLGAHFSSLIPGNVALFFPSYDMRDRISIHFKSHKQLFYEKPDMSKEDKERFIADFKSVKESGGVLLAVTGANFAEGVDFPGDLLNGVIVVGLPLSKPDLKTNELINYYQKRFGKGWDYGYIYPAMSKCIQSAGRCIRSETDRGVIIYLDERFAWPNYFSCLPREGLRVTKDYETLLKEFFARRA